ncbi:unnamed protein product, partial [Heterosigma akashiwo]
LALRRHPGSQSRRYADEQRSATIYACHEACQNFLGKEVNIEHLKTLRCPEQSDNLEDYLGAHQLLVSLESQFLAESKTWVDPVTEENFGFQGMAPSRSLGGRLEEGADE